MAKKGEFKTDIKEWIAPVKESANSNWTKYVVKVSYNDGPANIDIRNVKFNDDGSFIFGKGISLADEEADATVDVLLKKGYGTLEAIEEALRERNSMFKDGDNIFDDDYEDNSPSKLVVDLPDD